MYQKIMVPLDGSELAECVLPHLEAITTGCKVTDVVFVRAVEPLHIPASVPARGEFGFREEDRKRMEEHHETAAQEYLSNLVGRLHYEGARLSWDVIHGKAADALADYAEKNGVDLILIASHGRSGVSRWVWGSVADRILRSSCVPVLMVRAPGCVLGI